MEPRRNIEHLPPEIRCRIWALVGRDERYQSLLGTSRTIRSDVLSLIPGIGISCRCPFNRPCKCGHAFDIKRLVITVESDVVRSWLKFSVTMTHSQGPSWTIDSLDDPMAKPLQYLRPQEILVDFQAPKTGYYLGAFMALRAKLFDVCTVLDLVRAQQQRSLRLHFSDPWAGSGRGPNTPFWENRPCYDRVCKNDVRRWYRRYDDPKFKVRQLEKRDCFLYFYEMIMTPFAMHWAWKNARVTFDRDPKKKSTSFTSSLTVAGRKMKTYHGFKALLLTIWAYSEQLMADGQMKRAKEYPTPDFEDYESISVEWTAQESHHETWRKALEYYLNFTIATSQDFTRIIYSVAWHQVGQLLVKLRSKRYSPRWNGFSTHHPGSYIDAGYHGLDRGHWNWNHDIIRRHYQAWCNNWDHNTYVFLLPSPGDDGWDSDPNETIGEDNGWNSDSDSDETIGFEEFRPLFLRFQRPSNWNWKSRDTWSGRMFGV